MVSYDNYNYIHEAILYEDVNINEPTGKHPFYIKALVPLETEIGRSIVVNRNNIANKHLESLSTQPMTSEITLDLYLPKYLLMDFDNEIVPKGTRFLACFVGGNINDCHIIGRCYK